MEEGRAGMGRRALLGLVGGSAAAAVAAPLALADTAPSPQRDSAVSGQHVDLIVRSRTIEVNGKAATVLGITQPDGLAGLYTVEDMPFRVRVKNHLAEQTLIHWHGIQDPFRQDGVPHIAAPPLRAGEMQDYQFMLRQSGSYWMHSHDDLQIQRLASAPLIIHDRLSQRADVQEIVLMLNDFTFADPSDMYAQLKAGHGPNVTARTNSKAAAPNYDAYLANYQTLDDPAVVRVAPRGRVRLRIVNASAMENYWLDLGDLSGTVIAVDGSPVHPVPASAVPLAVAQRVDIVADIPAGGGAFPIIAQVENKTRRTGIVLATQDARIGKLDSTASQKSPKFGFTFERQLRALLPLGINHPQYRYDVALTADIAKYVWKMRHQAFPDITPIEIARGATATFSMQNRTTSVHPMHLHGHRFQVVAVDQDCFAGAVRDTVLVPPGKTVTIAFYADDWGRWAYHCHNLYHYVAGMFTVVAYKGVNVPKFPPLRT